MTVPSVLLITIRLSSQALTRHPWRLLRQCNQIRYCSCLMRVCDARCRPRPCAPQPALAPTCLPRLPGSTHPDFLFCVPVPISGSLYLRSASHSPPTARTRTTPSPPECAPCPTAYGLVLPGTPPATVTQPTPTPPHHASHSSPSCTLDAAPVHTHFATCHPRHTKPYHQSVLNAPPALPFLAAPPPILPQPSAPCWCGHNPYSFTTLLYRPLHPSFPRRHPPLPSPAPSPAPSPMFVLPLAKGPSPSAPTVTTPGGGSYVTLLVQCQLPVVLVTGLEEFKR